MEQKEIIPGMTTEEIKAVFFNADALREPNYKLFQLNESGHRYYYRFNEQGEPIFYPSVTTLLSQTMPTSPWLIDWIAENGREQANEKRDTAAAYGTLMHAQFERVVVSRSYNFDLVPSIVAQYLEENNLPEKYQSEWVIKLKKDVLSFIQFVRDYKVRPLAIEIGLYSERGYAGCVDMPCVMTDKNGEFSAIVDFKSGRKGFYESCELQLGLYREMWNENFPDFPVTRIFNFSPKDWRKSPTYNLKEQTEAKSLAKISHLLALAAIEDEERDNNVTIIQGSIQLDGEGFDGNLKILSLAEVVKDRHTEAEPSNLRSNESLFEE